MRKFVLSGFAVFAISIMAPTSTWAFSTEQASPSNGASANLADPDEALKALQDKVDNKNGSNQGGFYFSAGPAQQWCLSATRLCRASAGNLNSEVGDLSWPPAAEQAIRK
jgi:hypothetical protein